MERAYTIGAVERRTGVSQDLIRTWERRYGALQPMRTPTNRRRYTEEDVERLRLLRSALERGHSIGAIASLSTSALQNLVKLVSEPTSVGPAADADAGDLLADCVAAATAMSADALAAHLAAAATRLGTERFVRELAAPFLEKLGRDWGGGRLHAAQEHLASAVLRTQLGRLLGAAAAAPGGGPVAVAATPAGQAHEMGALMSAVVAAGAGYSTRFLGASLPAEEIAWAVQATEARVVLLSIVYPPDDPLLPSELVELRHLIGNGVPILAGGRAAQYYAGALSSAQVELCPSLDEMRERLDALRTAAHTGAL